MEESDLQIVTKFTDQLRRIFNLEITDANYNEDLQNCFKVIVFDDYVFNIISPFLKVSF